MMIGLAIGSYVLESKLGEGGMGEVYLGRHKSLETLAAVKVMSPAFSHDPRLHERFSREAKTQAQLRHPNIAQVLDHVEQDGRWYLVVEYLPNGTLEDVLENRREPLPLAEALAWSRQALLGLDHAHQNGVVHRDIKPANLLINERGEAAVTDFGIALEAGARRLTQTGVSIGTPEYMSPEQIRGAADLDQRTDIYSMGVVVYELLANRVPFQADSMFEVQRAQVSDPPPPLRSVAPQVPEALEAVVMRALAKLPDDRYQSCADFVKAIEAFERGERPVPPPPPRNHRRTVLESVAAPPAISSQGSTIVGPKVSMSSPAAPSPAMPALSTAPRQGTVVLASDPAHAKPSPPLMKKKRAWRGWAAAIALALAVLGIGALFMGEDAISDDADAAVTKLVEEIEGFEQEAATAAAAAKAASGRAVAEAAEAGQDAKSAASAATAGSCSLAQNHAQSSGHHAGLCQAAATEAAAEAVKAESVAERAAETAEQLVAEQQARRDSPLRDALLTLAGLAYASDNTEFESALHRRGFEASKRAGDAASNARAAGDTAQAATQDAEKAAGNAQSAAASCTAASRMSSGSVTPQPGARQQGAPQAPPGVPGNGQPSLPSFGALPDKPVVAVLAVGDPLMAATVEATLEKRLLRGGFDVRDELNSLELAALLEKRGERIDMSEVLPILVREGFHVAVLVKVEEGGRRRLSVRGQNLSATAARLRLNAHLLPARRSLGRGWSERVEYTELSAEAKGKQAFIGATAELVPAIRDGWSTLRGGG